jgi:hypothetical protein
VEARGTTPRRAFLQVILACGVTLWVGRSAAESVEVPVRLQAELLSKVVAYDRNYAARAHGHALVLVLVKPGDAESERIGEQIHGELGVLSQFGGLPHSEEVVRFSSRRALAELVKSRGAAAVYLSLGFGEEMPGIASVLGELSVLSVAVTPSYVPKGAVLGFDAEAGRPKLVVNLQQARLQKVAFRPELLKLARVIP